MPRYGHDDARRKRDCRRRRGPEAAGRAWLGIAGRGSNALSFDGLFGQIIIASESVARGRLGWLDSSYFKKDLGDFSSG